MPSTGLEPAITTIEQLQTYNLDLPAAGIVLRWNAVVKSDEKQIYPRDVSFASQA